MKLKKLLVTPTRWIGFMMLSICLAATSHSHAQDFEWVRGFGGKGNLSDADRAWATCVDKQGYVYVTGAIEDTASFGTNILISAGNIDAFVAKYDPAGNLIWAKRMGGLGADDARGLVVNDSGEVFVTGTFTDTTVFGPGLSSGPDTLTSSGNRKSMFLAKYSPQGNYQWAKAIVGNSTKTCWEAAIDRSGNVYMTGQFNGTIDFDPGPQQAIYTSTGGVSAFLAKYDTDGNLLWAKNTGGGLAYSVATDGSNNVYVTGSYEGISNFNLGGPGGVVNPYASNADIYLVKYDSLGNFLWVKGLGGNGGDGAYKVVVDGAENVYITGIYGLLGSGAEFNPGNPGGNGVVYNWPGGLAGIFSYSDIFLAKYTPNGDFIWVKSMGGIETEEAFGLAVARNGNIYVIGSFQDQADFDPRPADTAWLTSGGGAYDIYLAQYDSSGNYISAVSMGGTGDDRGIRVIVDHHGNVYGVGAIRYQTANFNRAGNGSDTLAIKGGSGWDGYIFKLSCNDTSSSDMTVTECGASYILNEQAYTATGTYTQTFPNRAGCDSILTLNLTIVNISKPAINVNGYTLSTTGTYDTYQWFRNDTLIPGATASSYTVTENANYEVVVTKNTCSDTSIAYRVNNVSVNDMHIAGRINIYPNPAHNVIYINSPVQTEILLTGIDGKAMRTFQNANTISLEGMPEGIYFLRIHALESGRLIKVEKFVKQ